MQISRSWKSPLIRHSCSKCKLHEEEKFIDTADDQCYQQYLNEWVCSSTNALLHSYTIFAGFSLFLSKKVVRSALGETTVTVMKFLKLEWHREAAVISNGSYSE